MEVKTFKAQNMAEALNMTKKNLGPEAMILSARNLYDGKGGVEVSAVASTEGKKKKPEVEDRAPADDVTVRDLIKNELSPLYEEFAALRRMMREVRQLTDQAILPGFTEIRNMFKEYSEAQESGRILGPLYNELITNGVMPRLARDLVRTCEMEIGIQNLNTIDWLTLARGLMQQIIARQISASGPLVPGDTGRIFAFCGPSGVGKTTTMAKIASRMSLSEGMNVVLVLTDTYCVGALDQARRYAELIGIPLVVAERPEMLSSVLRSYQSADAILIATPGRAFENDEAMRSVRAILAASSEPVQTCLHIPSTFSPDHQAVVSERFAVLNPQRLIVTKVDEARVRGGILNIQHITSLPIAYLTTGSRVPEDLEVAKVDRIARYVLNMEN